MFHVTLEQYALTNKTGWRYGDRTKYKNLGRNQMLWDFGLPKDDFDNEQAILAKIEEIDATFDMILIADMFDESMVLLKNLLCWSYEEMTYLKLNSLKKEMKSQISPEARAALKEWLWGDYLLYDHFKKKFEATINEFGRDKLEQEMRILKTANGNVKKRCIQAKVDNRELKGQFHTWSNDVEGYQVIIKEKK